MDHHYFNFVHIQQILDFFSSFQYLNSDYLKTCANKRAHVLESDTHSMTDLH